MAKISKTRGAKVVNRRQASTNAPPKAKAGKAKVVRTIELKVDREIRRRADALSVLYTDTPMDVDREKVTAHALVDAETRALAEGLMRDPLFVTGVGPRFVGFDDNDEHARYEDVATPASTFSNGSGQWGGGELSADSASGVADLRLQRPVLHAVDDDRTIMRMRPLRDGEVVIPARAMSPVQFEISGKEAVTLFEAGVVEEACIFLVRGELETEVEGADRPIRKLRATPDVEGPDRSCACMTLDPEDEPVIHPADEGATLPRVKIKSTKGAMGVLVWYARRETRIEANRLVSRNPSVNVSLKVVPLGGALPVGPGALTWARDLPRLSQRDTVHGPGEQAGNFSVRDPWTASLSTRRLDVRVVLVPGGMIDADASHARHPHPDQEMLIVLHGGVVTSIIPRHLVRAERTTATIADVRRLVPDFEPTRFMGAALNEELKFEPNVLLVDARDLHALATANYADAVFLHVLHSENVRERRWKELGRPKPSELPAPLQDMRLTATSGR